MPLTLKMQAFIARWYVRRSEGLHPVPGWRLTQRLPLWRQLISTATCFCPAGAWACSLGALPGTIHRYQSITVQ